MIAYETNVKNIKDVHSKMFTLTLANGRNIDCFLKKTINISLTMICKLDIEFEFSLGKVEKTTVLNNINIKYNFVIQPINNNEKCVIYDYGGALMFSIPKVLNFTSQDTITVDFAMVPSQYLKGIKLNPEANEELKCSNINNIYKRCTVPKNLFRNKDNGYYYIHHVNHNNKLIIFYESSPLKVVLPENELYISIKKKTI
jgi:hypothetical protein